jgi:transposase
MIIRVRRQKNREKRNDQPVKSISPKAGLHFILHLKEKQRATNKWRGRGHMHCDFLLDTLMLLYLKKRPFGRAESLRKSVNKKIKRKRIYLHVSFNLTLLTTNAEY